MTLSPWLYSFLEQWERFRPTAYLPTKNDRWTIGYGHTDGVKEGDTCTMDQAKAWLQEDVQNIAVNAISAHIPVPLTQNQYDALCSIIFNCGFGKPDGVKGDIADSTLVHELNDKHYTAAADEFLKWDHQNGVVLAGLRDRRKAERDHFLA